VVPPRLLERRPECTTNSSDHEHQTGKSRTKEQHHPRVLGGGAASVVGRRVVNGLAHTRERSASAALVGCVLRDVQVCRTKDQADPEDRSQPVHRPGSVGCRLRLRHGRNAKGGSGHDVPHPSEAFWGRGTGCGYRSSNNVHDTRCDGGGGGSNSGGNEKHRSDPRCVRCRDRRPRHEFVRLREHPINDEFHGRRWGVRDLVAGIYAAARCDGTPADRDARQLRRAGNGAGRRVRLDCCDRHSHAVDWQARTER
jgi:hypothetical protein